MASPAPGIGKHLACLNLFREPDGSVQITVASGTGACAEFDRGKAGTHQTPNDYVLQLAAQAVGGPAREALTKCRDKFLHYEQLHRLKCTAEGDEKADRNREMADMCNAVLAHG